MLRVMLWTVCAGAMPILGSVPAASADRDSAGFFQMRVAPTASTLKNLTGKQKQKQNATKKGTAKKLK